MAPGLLMRRLLLRHHLADFLAEHPLDFVLHRLGAGFAEMRPHPVSDVADFLDHRGWCLRDGGTGGCLAGIVGHKLSFQIHHIRNAKCNSDFNLVSVKMSQTRIKIA